MEVRRRALRAQGVGGGDGLWEWQTPVNGPFPVLDASRLDAVADWLRSNGYTVQVLDEMPS